MKNVKDFTIDDTIARFKEDTIVTKEAEGIPFHKNTEH